MDAFNLIIDRVGDRNVFNLFSGRTPGREAHLQTRVQDDLIDDFLSVVRRVALLSGSIDDDREEGDLTGHLFRAGEIVFRQFFPERIRDILRRSEGGVLFLHVDQALGHIPWELLHDGVSFLADRFIIGRNIAGAYSYRDGSRQDRSRLRILIVADPTNDLPSAAREGQMLYETLNAEISSDLIDIRFLSGRRIGRLALLEEMQGADIVHYAGHTGRDEEGETGWLLHGGKILRSSEIEQLRSAPNFVFANSCSSFGSYSLDEANRMASAFLRSGVSGYIGTSWDIADTEEVIEFALEFYRNIFLERSVGEALFEARQKARKRNRTCDLTWAAYSLHGNPGQRLFRYPARRSFDASRSVLNVRRVLEDYPLPVALHYARFVEAQEQTGIPDPSAFKLLRSSFLWMMSFTGGLLFGLYRKLALKGEQPQWKDGNYESCAAHIHRFARRLHVLNLEGRLPGLVQPLLLHRDNIVKMIEIIRFFESSDAADNQAEQLSYLITFQYLLENLFVDLSLLGRVEYFQNTGPAWPAILFRGQKTSTIRILPAYARVSSLEKELESFAHHLCVYVPSRKMLIDLSDGFSFEEGMLKSSLFELEMHVDVSE
ncbi:MAG: CHAT domain-containing protein [Leptonema illini]|uniref:CHAT domain-containing protein n=1 Tax=Leptonema illini TaxID=183 RepID=A0A833GZE1_9LEPT|nr:MAG: CHAT domain-containing protein [Leptonema illini]